MNSVILHAMARLFFIAMLVFSLFVLLRGHNEPGGGFIGGLAASAAFAVATMAFGVETGRRWLVMHPIALLGTGLILAIASGLPPLLAGQSAFLTHLWTSLAGVKLGTTIVFDLGVYLVVLGSVLAILFRLYDTQASEAQ